jgi:hypothetical protein
MAIRGRELKDGTKSWQVRLRLPGGQELTENAGRSKTDTTARALEARIKRELKNGTYAPRSARRKNLTVRDWLDEYFAARTNRTRDNDVGLVENHVLAVAWFAEMPLGEVRPRDVLRWVDGIRSRRKEARATGERGFGEKSLSILYGLVQTAFGRAQVEELIRDNPFVLGEMKRGSERRPPERKSGSPTRARMPGASWRTSASHRTCAFSSLCGSTAACERARLAAAAGETGCAIGAPDPRSSSTRSTWISRSRPTTRTTCICAAFPFILCSRQY